MEILPPVQAPGDGGTPDAAPRDAPPAGGRDGRGDREWRIPVAIALAALGFWIYAPSFPGGPISDDVAYLLNPWVVRMNADDLLQVWNPASQITIFHNNYAPIRPLLHALEWRLFPEDSTAYHAVNLAVHTAVSFLLFLLLARSGLPPLAAALGAGWFLVHPANVEAVAWMSQLWSPAALALGLGALLCQRRRPLASVLLFAAALLTKPLAICLLPVALLRAWAWREPDGGAGDGGRAWIGWLAVGGAVAAVELWVFLATESGTPVGSGLDGWTRARTIVATAARYAAMAATGLGVSTFHEPRPALSWLDPWWGFGVVLALAIGARALRALREHREEAAWWAWAPAAFLPVSQIFPFLYPMGDRYLYFMLPGLIGGTLLAGADAAARWAPASAATRRRAAVVASAAALAVLAAFAFTARDRARLWTSTELVARDAAEHYPEGVAAQLQRAREAARRGDLDAVVEAIERCRARGWDYYGYLQSHPDFEPVRHRPRFQALLESFAAEQVARTEARSPLTQMDLRDLAEAYALLGRYAEAVDAVERGLALGGPMDAELRARLGPLRLRAERAARENGA